MGDEEQRKSDDEQRRKLEEEQRRNLEEAKRKAEQTRLAMEKKQKAEAELEEQRKRRKAKEAANRFQVEPLIKELDNVKSALRDNMKGRSKLQQRLFDEWNYKCESAASKLTVEDDTTPIIRKQIAELKSQYESKIK